MFVLIIFMVDTLRNDLFVTLVRADLDKGSKSAQKNVEMRLIVFNKDGNAVPVRKCFIIIKSLPQSDANVVCC